MTFLPIVARELRVAARRRSTYWVRSGAALLVMLIGSWIYLMMRSEAPQFIATALFNVLTLGAVLHCWVSGLRATADCLSQEKREGTLGLLFLTDLKGYDVVLGKLAASSLNSLYGMLAVVPMFAIPLLLGGVAPKECWRMALVALDTLFFSLTVGICVSSVCHSARKARSLTFLLLLFFTGVCPAAGALLNFRYHLSQANYLFLLSPGFAYATAFDTLYSRSGGQGFWVSLGLIHAISWLCVAVAAFIAPRSWQDRPATAQRLRWRERWQLWSHGNFAERRAFRRRLLEQNAYFWLAARARLKPATVWAVLGLLACLWLLGLTKYHREDWLNSGTYFITALVLNCLLKGWVASESTRQIASERQQGSLELLLSTPLAERDILRGQFLALKRQFLGPVLLVLALGFILMCATAHDATDADERACCYWGYLAGMGLLGADLLGLYWTGLWQGLTSKNPHRAAQAVTLRILVLPWVAYAAILVVVSIYEAVAHDDLTWRFFLGLWVVLSLAADLGFGLWSRSRLLTEFRLAAEERFSPRVSLWKRLLAKSPEATAVNCAGGATGNSPTLQRWVGAPKDLASRRDG